MFPSQCYDHKPYCIFIIHLIDYPYHLPLYSSCLFLHSPCHTSHIINEHFLKQVPCTYKALDIKVQMDLILNIGWFVWYIKLHYFFRSYNHIFSYLTKVGVSNSTPRSKTYYYRTYNHMFSYLTKYCLNIIFSLSESESQKFYDNRMEICLVYSLKIFFLLRRLVLNRS